MVNTIQKKKVKRNLKWVIILSLILSNLTYSQIKNHKLESLFKEWRAFEIPPQIEGVPDYSQETFDKRLAAYQNLRSKLETLPK